MAPAPGGARFLLLHRRRVWNEGERRWIGWERKRGKLHELNRLLRGATDTTFVTHDRQPSAVPADVRYVITLDADTQTAARHGAPADRQDGASAQPAALRCRAGRVVEGYAVLQPRVTPSLPVGREGSLFQRVFSSMSGIDPYASAVSDVYQDLFGEGSYAGKGIYEVDAFEAALAGRVPDSTLLSHDLFEGVFARAGLASDVEVVEEFPARYDVAALAPPPLGARRLAAAAVDLRSRPRRQRGSQARRHSGDRPLEDARQSAPDAVGAGGGRSRLLVGMDAAVRRGGRLDCLRPRDDRAADLDSGRRCRRPGRPASRCAATSARSAPISGSRSLSRRC